MKITIPVHIIADRRFTAEITGDLLDIAPHLDCTLVVSRSCRWWGWSVTEAECGCTVFGHHRTRQQAIDHVRFRLAGKTQRDVDRARRKLVTKYPEILGSSPRTPPEQSHE